MSTVALFTRSANAFVELLGQIRADQWELPALGNWDVRSLAGHTARAILTVENYLSAEEPGTVSVSSADAYYTAIYPQFTDAASVEARGVEAGAWLGDDPIGQVGSALARTEALIDAQPPNRIVGIGGMGIPLIEYLHTRVFELVVHTIDLAHATGIEHELPTAAIADSLELAARVAAHGEHAEQVLLALTGRGPLPDGFSVV